MGKIRLASLMAALALLVGMGVVTRASTAATDLSTNSGIASFLRSHGLDPGHFVIQRGVRNYAGPHCPGAGWNCTTVLRVVQVASKANVIECPQTDTCTGATQGTATGSTDNVFICHENETSSSPAEDCGVTQINGSGDNHVDIRQKIKQDTGSSQQAIQRAEITQTTDSGSNFATVMQDVMQSIKEDAASQAQSSNQSATFTQISTSGRNTIFLTHTLRQDEKTDQGGGTQDQSGQQRGHIKQTSSGVSVFRVDQDAKQKMEGTPTTGQFQDPFEICCANQAGNTADQGTINQSADQSESPFASQTSFLEADCSSSGNCTANQTLTQNGVTMTNQQSGPAVLIVTGNQCFESCLR